MAIFQMNLGKPVPPMFSSSFGYEREENTKHQPQTSGRTSHFLYLTVAALLPLHRLSNISLNFTVLNMALD